MFAYRVRIFLSNLLIILVVTSTLTNALSWLLGAVTRLHSHELIKTGRLRAPK